MVETIKTFSKDSGVVLSLAPIGNHIVKANVRCQPHQFTLRVEREWIEKHRRCNGDGQISKDCSGQPSFPEPVAHVILMRGAIQQNAGKEAKAHQGAQIADGKIPIEKWGDRQEKDYKWQ